MELLIPVGRERVLEPMADRRTPAQREAVARIVATETAFDHSFNNPFTDEVDAWYRGPFNFLWYDVRGGLHLQRIGSDGRILTDVVA